MNDGSWVAQFLHKDQSGSGVVQKMNSIAAELGLPPARPQSKPQRHVLVHPDVYDAWMSRSGRKGPKPKPKKIATKAAKSTRARKTGQGV